MKRRSRESCSVLLTQLLMKMAERCFNYAEALADEAESVVILTVINPECLDAMLSENPDIVFSPYCDVRSQCDGRVYVDNGKELERIIAGRDVRRFAC